MPFFKNPSFLICKGQGMCYFFFEKKRKNKILKKKSPIFSGKVFSFQSDEVISKIGTIKWINNSTAFHTFD